MYTNMNTVQGVVQSIVGILTFGPRLLLDFDDPVGVSQVKPADLLSSYDFIVVGAGSTGSVVAGRLAQWTSASVLLLEAGGDGSLLTEIPSAVGVTLGGALDWSYLTTPDGRACLGMRRDQCLIHSGKVVGGGSTVNGMLYVRGDREDFEEWERLGNPGWGWDGVLPYFKRSEDQLNPAYAKDSENHGVGGPLPVSDVKFKTPLADAFLEAAHYKGFPIRDINTGNSTGFTFMQATMRDGKRFSTAKSFLKPVIERPNLTVLSLARVERLLFSEDSNSPRITGIEFTREGKRLRVRARKEVILCAGVIGTPKLLLLSGIGPRADLEPMGIPVVKDLPVGKNMQSHVGTGEVVFTLEQPVSFNPVRLFTNPLNQLAYLNRGNGPLGAVSGFEGMGIYRTGLDPSSSWPDIQINLISVTPGVDAGLVYRNSINMDDQMFSKWKPLAFQEGFTLLPVLLHPKSRGSVSLRSRDPEDPPDVRPNFFSHPQDVATLIAGVKQSLSLGLSPSFTSYGSQFYDRPLEACGGFQPYTDQYWECAIRYFTYPLYHDVGTCRMGPASEPSSVVDSRLLVHGVTGLRIADASIFPRLVSGNTNAACIMVGEKAVDLIRVDWGL